jgi:hypothetical protein
VLIRKIRNKIPRTRTTPRTIIKLIIALSIN